MCSTCSGSGPAIDLHCVQSNSADMDVNRENLYCSPAEDSETAIKKSMMNLRDIEVRCFRAAPMCYSSSSENENKAFYVRCLAAAISGGVAVFSGAAASHTAKLIIKLHSNFKYLNYLIGSGSAILVFAGMMKGIEKVIPSIYERKAEKLNEAAAEWQLLELRIKAFLAAAVKDTITVDNCKQYTEECAEKRKEICLIARPDQSVYKQYESDMDLILDRKKRLRQIHEKIIEEKLFSS
ncbi:uncharacterized protein [Haliotis cracherodii]|uniref:uncharacterized protein n=1 Tax=Haliotis cracherodii TaxID=6455 RepID=UPI0039ED4A69